MATHRDTRNETLDPPRPRRSPRPTVMVVVGVLILLALAITWLWWTEQVTLAPGAEAPLAPGPATPLQPDLVERPATPLPGPGATTERGALPPPAPESAVPAR